MSGISPVRLGRPLAATAVLQVSRERQGISGVVREPGGEPVPIAAILSRVLDRYGLADGSPVTPDKQPRQAKDHSFDVLA